MAMTKYQCPGCGGVIVGAEVCPDCRMQFPANVETVEEGMNIDNLRALLATRESMHAKPLSRIEATEELIYALPALLDRLEAAEADAVVWRHIAQERYADFRRAVDPKETGYPVDGALDSLFNAYRKTGKFNQVFCSQCGGAFPSNYHGYSHCTDHAAIDAAREPK